MSVLLAEQERLVSELSVDYKVRRALQHAARVGIIKLKEDPAFIERDLRTLGSRINSDPSLKTSKPMLHTGSTKKTKQKKICSIPTVGMLRRATISV